jgi:hypothetical protein
MVMNEMTLRQWLYFIIVLLQLAAFAPGLGTDIANDGDDGNVPVATFNILEDELISD